MSNPIDDAIESIKTGKVIGYEGTLIRFDHTDGSHTRIARDAFQDATDPNPTRLADLMDAIVHGPEDPSATAQPLTLEMWVEFQRKHMADVEPVTPDMSSVVDVSVYREQSVSVDGVIRRLEQQITSEMRVLPLDVNIMPTSGFDRRLIDEMSRRLAEAAGIRHAEIVQSEIDPSYTERSQTYVDAEYTVVDERTALGPGAQPAEDD